MKDLTSKYIVIEGPIGVGKTSLSNKLALEWDAELILENVDTKPSPSSSAKTNETKNQKSKVSFKEMFCFV